MHFFRKKFGPFRTLVYLCTIKQEVKPPKKKKTMNFVSYHMNDGADWQARSVCAYLGQVCTPSEVDLNVYRYVNGREQGYIFTARKKKDGETFQRNYAVYEHRNSDDLCVVVNDTMSFGAPASSVIYDGMKDKWDVTRSFNCGQIVECGNYIINDIEKWSESLDEDGEDD